jgi:hypothetical protein
MKKETEIILAVGAVVVALYAAHELAQGANQAEGEVGQGAGEGAKDLLGLAGLGVFAWIVALAAL